MNMFRIDSTDFGIDVAKSNFDLRPDEQEISIVIWGDEGLYKKLADHENSEWKWTLYPPKLYVSACPLRWDASNRVWKNSLDIEDIRELEAALYLMEHNDILSMQMTCANDALAVNGVVDLFGEFHAFEIHWEARLI